MQGPIGHSQKQRIFKKGQYIKTHDGNSLEMDSFVTKDNDILYLRWSDFHVSMCSQTGEWERKVEQEN